MFVKWPRYANAIDYMRAHKFSLVWFGECIGELGKLRAQYIGAENTSGMVEPNLPREVERVISEVKALDSKKARVLTKYFQEMDDAILQMHRVLELGRACVIVVGPSVMRGVEVPTHQCLAAIAESQGFELVEIAPRKLDRDRRMMPAVFRPNHNSQIHSPLHQK